MKHALCLLNHTTNYKSDPQGILFNDRLHNLPVLKDVWDARKKRIKARNFAIFAPTGEGKSFLANNILRQFFEQGVRLVIIDLGGSYNKFAKLYPDDHIVLYRPTRPKAAGKDEITGTSICPTGILPTRANQYVVQTIAIDVPCI